MKDVGIDGSPTLVVKIMLPSSGRKDRLQKLRIYQEVKVQHYWLVNPDERTLEWDDDIIEHPSFEPLYH